MFIGRDNRYEHEVTPLGGTRMRIPVAARKLLCSEVLLGLISMVVPIRRHGGLLYKSPTGGNVDGHACMHRYISIGQDNRYEQVEPQARIANTCQRHASCFAAE